MNVVGTVYLNGCNYQVGYDLLSQNTPGNYSTVRFYGVLNVTNNYISWSRGTASVWGASKGLGTRYNKGSHTVVQQDANLYHDDKGKYSATLSGTLNTTFVSGTASGNFSLPKINRYPVLQSGQNFTDEENPTIKFTSYGTFPLRAKLEAGGNTQLIIRDLPSKTATSYTFELTDEEREKLRKLIPTSNSLQVTETICAMSGNKELSASPKTYTMTLVNGNPVFSNFEFEDVNEKTVALTGNNKINVNGYSNIKVTIPIANKAIAQKNATMVKYQLQVLNNDVLEIPYSDTEDVSGTMIGANQGIYNLYALDSRNNSTLVTKLATKSINYSPLTINQVQAKAVRDESGVGTNCTISFDGTFWNDTFGEVTNTIDGFEYEFKKSESSEWIKGTTKLTPTINGNNFTFNGSIKSNNADYSWDLESAYNIKIKISDKLSSGEVNVVLNSGRPNLAIAKNGVAIMSKYDEDLGGYGQINGNPLAYYPIGAIYISASETSPETLFGGTWEQIKDTFLLSAGDKYKAGTVGGEATHKLTASELPAGTAGGGTNNKTWAIAHWDNYSNYAYVMTTNDDSHNTTTKGLAGQPHNNMPPYLAVYVWKRIG